MAQNGSVITLLHANDYCVVSRPETYAALLALVRHTFPALANVSDADISICFTPEHSQVEVVINKVSFYTLHRWPELRVKINPCNEACSQAPATKAFPSCQRSGDNDEAISVHISSVTGAKYTTFNSPVATSISITSGGKPAIYLLSPEPIFAASVTVELSEVWDFSALYPVVDVSRMDKEVSRVTWNVGVDQDGYIVDHTGTKYTYLYWEAINTVPPYGQLKPSDFNFSHTSPELRAEVSIVLPFPDVIRYLETTLAHLTLTTSMRQEFMTHWMPHFHKHHRNQSDIAIAFIPQKVYNEDAKLTIRPEPAAVGRVFMLFAGVKTDGSQAEWNPLEG
ncbi:hypothetical protein OPQ81_011860 [Rhizoctonia solani]|nr:hypothetical protein OPQ81_011860 [Rhizoctonia solani]